MDSKQGAEEFGEWFWKSLGESVAVGDTSIPKKYSSTTCSVCKKALEGTQDAAEKYGTADFNPYTVEVKSSEYESGRSFIKMHVAFDDYQLKRGGTVGAKIKGDASDLVLEVRYAQGSWKAQKWTLLR